MQFQVSNPVEPPPCSRSGRLGQDLLADFRGGVDLLECELTVAWAEPGLVAEVAPGLAREVAQLPRVQGQGAIHCLLGVFNLRMETGNR